MQPFQFGNPHKLLYGTYHTPSSKARDICILMCPPIAYEYQQSWWAYKQMANRLAKQGFPTLKFDYYATGNSYGETQEGCINQWLEDINTAAQILLERSGKKKLAVVGLRFGATLAALAMNKINPSVIVLWDLIISGKHYLNELSILHQQKLDSLGQSSQNKTAHEYHGYLFSDPLHSDIRAINLNEHDSWINKQTQITLLSPPNNEIHQKLITYLKENGHSHNYKTLEEINNWQNLKAMESFILPNETIKTICNIFSGYSHE